MAEYPRADLLKLGIQSLISLILLVTGLYILLSGDYETGTQKLAAGWVGAVIGYWLK